jgi:hypothetical protein
MQIRITVAEKQHCTIMLTVRDSGQKLPPYVVLKEKLMGKKTFPHGIVIWVQESDCVTKVLVDGWIKSIWF